MPAPSTCPCPDCAAPIGIDVLTMRLTPRPIPPLLVVCPACGAPCSFRVPLLLLALICLVLAAVVHAALVWFIPFPWAWDIIAFAALGLVGMPMILPLLIVRTQGLVLDYRRSGTPGERVSALERLERLVVKGGFLRDSTGHSQAMTWIRRERTG